MREGWGEVHTLVMTQRGKIMQMVRSCMHAHRERFFFLLEHYCFFAPCDLALDARCAACGWRNKGRKAGPARMSEGGWRGVRRIAGRVGG